MFVTLLDIHSAPVPIYNVGCQLLLRPKEPYYFTNNEKGERKKKWGVIPRTAWSLLSRSRPLSSPSFSLMENLLIPFQVFNILSLSLNIFRFFRVYFHSCFPMVYNFFAYSPFFFWKKKNEKTYCIPPKLGTSVGGYLSPQLFYFSFVFF